MTELERFNEAVRNDPDMLAELKEAGTSMEEIIAFANRKGFSLTAADIEQQQTSSEELSEDELDDVAGGKKVPVKGGVVVQKAMVCGVAVVAS